MAERRIDLGRLLPGVGVEARVRHAVCELCSDSRDVVADSAFIASEGRRTDGHRFIPDAVRAGARVVFHRTGRGLGLDPAACPDVDFIAVADPRELGKRLAPAFYGHPSRRMRVVAVTGTNGKTTCSCVLDRLSAALGRTAGVVNTLGIRFAGRAFQLDNHVPEPVVLQRTLAEMVDAGVDTLALEVTSYALAMDRVYGIELDAAILTNVTRDHLDVHGTPERYLAAKLRLFELLERSAKPQRTAALWRDCTHFDAVRRHLAGHACGTTSYGIDDGERAGDDGLLAARNVRLDPQGTTFDLAWHGAVVPAVRTCLLGSFNVLNVLAALAVERELLDRLAAGDRLARELLDDVLRDLRVPGRLEAIPNDRGATILVDYAHTDDGLLRVLTTLQALPHRRLVTVFGCGGDRDRGKRPRMGRVASELSDLVILTSDNPRTEEPERILREIEAGIVPGRTYRIVENRERAIEQALSLVREGDILLVAGKGHEDRQLVGTTAVPFRDGDVLRRHL